MTDSNGIGVFVNRAKLDEYERKKLKEVVENLKNRELEQKIHELYGDVGEKDIKIQTWNNYSVLLIELNPKYMFNEDNEEKDELADLRDFILKKYGRVFLNHMMEGNILMIGGNIYHDNLTSSSEKLELSKDKLSTLGRLVFDAIAEKNDYDGAFRLLKELSLENRVHQLDDVTLRIGGIKITNDCMRIKLRMGKEKRYRIVTLIYDEEESKPSKIVFMLESNHYDHLMMLKKLLKSLLTEN
jgi:hypothetical protein